MKILRIIHLPFLFLAAVAVLGQDARLVLSEPGNKTSISRLEVTKLSDSLPGSCMSYCRMNGAVAENQLIACLALNPRRRNTVKVEFTPKKNGIVILRLCGPSEKTGAGRAEYIYWDNVRIDGGIGFKGGFDQNPQWRWSGNARKWNGLADAPKWFGSDRCAKLDLGSLASLPLRVNAGHKVAITVDVASSAEKYPTAARSIDSGHAPSPNLFLRIGLENIHSRAASWLLHFDPKRYGKNTTEKQPWESTLLKPGPCDLVGPDGVLYPDFRRAGIPGGIPDIPVAIRLSDLGSVPGTDLAACLEKAVTMLPPTGGAILIGEGNYILSRPVFIHRDNVVIRGSGKDRTVVDFRFGLPEKGIRIYCPRLDGADAVLSGQNEIRLVTNRDVISIHADPLHMKTIKVTLDGVSVAGEYNRNNNSPRTRGIFFCNLHSKNILEKFSAGRHQLRISVEWRDGSSKIVEKTLRIPEKIENAQWLIPEELAAINFTRTRWTGQNLIAKDAVRGDSTVVIKGPNIYKSGDYIEVVAKPTKRFITRIRSAFKETPRIQGLIVAETAGQELRFTQPLRLDFPLEDLAQIRRPGIIAGSGVENFTLDQSRCNLWISGISMWWVRESWVKGLKILNTGRNPVLMRGKFSQISDCEFIGSQYNQGHGSGTAYAGFWSSFDCLMEDVTTRGMRHGPTINYSSSGCVIRNSLFSGSDAQLHCHYPYENLFENCVIDADLGTGSYGYGFFIQEPEAKPHGPQGPRNVIYNCDFKSPLAGLWAGGCTDGYRIVYNRFKVAHGPGVFAKSGAFDYLVKGNVFVLRKPYPAGVYLATPDCSGWTVEDNHFYYVDKVHAVGGMSKGNIIRRNTVSPYADAKRPILKVKSLFEWQKQNYSL